MDERVRRVRAATEKSERQITGERLVFRERPVEMVVSPENRRGPDVERRIPVIESTEISPPEIMETVEERRLISPDVKLPARDFPRRLETEIPGEPWRPVNLARRQRIEETSPSVNVRVSIGRVEIKAVQEPEPRIQRVPSVPVGPVVSLDDYLKSRDEEGR